MKDSLTLSSKSPDFMRDDKLTEECKALVASLPKTKDQNGYNLCKYKGFWYYMNTLQGVLNTQKNFQPKNTDIILASYPKTGTTWLKSLCFAIVEREKYRKNPENHPLLFQNPHNLVPFLEIDLYLHNEIVDLTSIACPGLIATHMALPVLHEAVKDSRCKIVYVCRNPKDMLVSLWHFQTRIENDQVRKEKLEVMVNSFCDGTLIYGPFWDQVLGYWKESLENPKRVLFIRYEDLKKEPHAEIRRLAEFLGCPFTKEEEGMGSVDEILRLCSIKKLSNLRVNKTGKSAIDIETKNFFRKGETGDWVNHLTPEMNNKIEDILQKKLQGSGLKF